MKIKILKSAQEDLKEGFWFYEKQEKGPGDYFLDTLFSDIESLQIYAGIHDVHFGRYHRMLSKRFPFAVYYRMDKNTVLIHAILDCRRNPAWTKDRMKQL